MRLSASLLFLGSLSIGLSFFFSTNSSASDNRGEFVPDPRTESRSHSSSLQVNCHSITNYFPRIGYSGYGVTVLGQNLTGVTAVRFANNVSASFEIINSTEIRAIVPLGAVSGPITISKTGCPDVATDTFTIPPVPTITLSPLTQFVGIGASTPIRVNFNRALIVPASILLSSSNPAVVTTPPVFPIPPGAISATFDVMGVSAGTNITITATLPSNLGGSSASASVSTIPRVISLASVSARAGSTVQIPLSIVSQNDENQINFSVSFNPTLLVNPQISTSADVPNATISTVTNQISQGLLGVRIELPTGLVINGGTRQIADLQFEIPTYATFGPTPVRFDDQPIERSVISGTSIPLPASFFSSGIVIISQGIEADSAPRPNGDGTLSTTDWVQVGRFVSGVDAAPNGAEFQRADCAPRANFGDGILSVTDWVQAGRYINKLDAISVAGGPTSPSATSFAAPFETPGRQDRRLQLVENIATKEFAVELNALGNENGIGFSLQFDAKKLRFQSIQKELLPPSATLLINDSESAQGRLGILLVLVPGEKLPGGLQSILKLAFVPLPGTTVSEPSIRFGDFPVLRQVSDAEANALPARFEGPTHRDFPFSPIAFIEAYRPSAESGNWFRY
jgi:hypothetical protein